MRARIILIPLLLMLLVSGGHAQSISGDVYVVKRMAFQTPLLEGQPVIVEIEVVDVRGVGGSVTLNFIVRDNQGNQLPNSFSDSTPISLPPGGGTHFYTSPDLTFEFDPNGLETGKTYTLFVSIPLYTGSPGEIVTGNNSALETFVILTPTVQLNVPDTPWWMFLVVGIGVMGFLGLGFRREN
ncbi:MAG: hypothetical protein Q8P05_03000 [Candidatus Diapherotrites archaeon]|nr:hypothetical protein [Candidatus Diapherotrites archaeon]MDZ4256375.1 hypothetical protein [archaeon]